MIDLIKQILGITVEDYDMYLVIIATVSILWIVKSVIHGVYNAILQLFH